MIGNLAATRWLGHPWRRRVIALVLILVFGLLALFPQKYRAAVTMTPTDPASLGLGGALGQLGAFSSVFGSQAAVEVGLKIARSEDVRHIVVQKLDLMKREGFTNPIDADRWLGRKVDIRSLRGGILQVDVKDRDPRFGLALVGAFADATRDRLGEIARNQTAYKRGVLEDLVRDSGRRLDRAQEAYDDFRRRTRFSDPGSAINAIGARVPELEQQLKSREIDLQAARSFATDDNMQVRQILAEMTALRTQLAEAKSLDASQSNSVNRVVEQSTEVQDLTRELGVAQSLYDSYKRYLSGTAVEDLTSSASIRILEPPFIDSDRQVNTLPASLLLLVVLVWLAIEFYQLRPPLAASRAPDDRG